MHFKQNQIPLLLGAFFLTAAIAYYLYDTSKAQKQIQTEQATGSLMNDPGAGSSILGKTVPPDHDALMNIQMLKDQLNKNPNDLNHLVQLGNLLYDKGDFKSAIEPYEKALALDPANTNVRNDYAVCFFNTGNAERAIAELNRILDADPRNITATFNLGVIHSNIGKTDKAKNYFSKTIELQPNSEFAQKARSMLGSLK